MVCVCIDFDLDIDVQIYRPTIINFATLSGKSNFASGVSFANGRMIYRCEQKSESGVKIIFLLLTTWPFHDRSRSNLNEIENCSLFAYIR